MDVSTYTLEPYSFARSTELEAVGIDYELVITVSRAAEHRAWTEKMNLPDYPYHQFSDAYHSFCQTDARFHRALRARAQSLGLDCDTLAYLGSRSADDQRS